MSNSCETCEFGKRFADYGEERRTSCAIAAAAIQESYPDSASPDCPLEVSAKDPVVQRRGDDLAEGRVA